MSSMIQRDWFTRFNAQYGKDSESYFHMKIQQLVDDDETESCRQMRWPTAGSLDVG